MKNKLRTLSILLLFTLLFLPTGSAQAQGPGPGNGQVMFGTNMTIESGDTYNGDLVLFGGNVTIEKDATLNGDLVVIGGRLESNGGLDGDVVVVGGQIKLDESAVVAGDVVTIGGQLQRAEGAQIEGEVVNNAAPTIDIPNGRVPSDVQPPKVEFNVNPFWTAAGIFYRALIVAALAMLVVVFLRPQMEYVGEAIVRQPVMSGGVGLLAVIGGPVAILVVTLILIVTIILIPVAALVVVVGALAIALAWLFGVIALGYEVGERFTQSINQTWAPVFTAGFGTFLVMLIGGAIGEIPCIGWLLTTLVGLVAVGAVAITRFGAKPAQGPAMTVSSPPADPGQVPPAS